MSKQVIEVMKKRMSLEERQKFCDNINKDKFFNTNIKYLTTLRSVIDGAFFLV